MNEQLVREVSQRTGISEDQARQAVTTVVEFLKKQLPAPIAGQIDNAVGGQGGSNLGQQAQQALSGLTGSHDR